MKIKVNTNNTSEFISPPIFVGLGSNSAWPCAANWCINTLCYIFSLIYFENSFPANKLSSWISSYPSKKSAICCLFLFLWARSGNIYRLVVVFFSFFCSYKNRKVRPRFSSGVPKPAKTANDFCNQEYQQAWIMPTLNRVVQIMYCPLKLKNWWQAQNFLII